MPDGGEVEAAGRARDVVVKRGGIRQDVAHPDDIDVGSVVGISDEPHRVAGHRILHRGGSIAVVPAKSLMKKRSEACGTPLARSVALMERTSASPVRPPPWPC